MKDDRYMKILLLTLGVILGLIAITLITESIEYSTVALLSGKSFEYLKSNQTEYFDIRNQPGFLIFKLTYNLLAAFTGGYLMTWCAKTLSTIGLYLLVGIQTVALIWVAFSRNFQTRLRPGCGLL